MTEPAWYRPTVNATLESAAFANLAESVGVGVYEFATQEPFLRVPTAPNAFTHFAPNLNPQRKTIHSLYVASSYVNNARDISLRLRPFPIQADSSRSAFTLGLLSSAPALYYYNNELWKAATRPENPSPATSFVLLTDNVLTIVNTSYRLNHDVYGQTSVLLGAGQCTDSQASLDPNGQAACDDAMEGTSDFLDYVAPSETSTNGTTNQPTTGWFSHYVTADTHEGLGYAFAYADKANHLKTSALAYRNLTGNVATLPGHRPFLLNAAPSALIFGVDLLFNRPATPQDAIASTFAAASGTSVGLIPQRNPLVRGATDQNLGFMVASLYTPLALENSTRARSNEPIISNSTSPLGQAAYWTGSGFAGGNAGLALACGETAAERLPALIELGAGFSIQTAVAANNHTDRFWKTEGIGAGTALGTGLVTYFLTRAIDKKWDIKNCGS